LYCGDEAIKIVLLEVPTLIPVFDLADGILLVDIRTGKSDEDKLRRHMGKGGLAERIDLDGLFRGRVLRAAVGFESNVDHTLDIIFTDAVTTKTLNYMAYVVCTREEVVSTLVGFHEKGNSPDFFAGLGAGRGSRKPLHSSASRINAAGGEMAHSSSGAKRPRSGWWRNCVL